MAISKIRSGIKTTEFWVSIIVAMLVAGADALGHPLNPETVAGLVALVVGYAFQRMGIKKAQ